MSDDAIEFRLRIPVPLYLFTCDCGARHSILDSFWIAVDWESGNHKLFCVSCQSAERPADAIDWSGYRAVIKP